MIERPISPAAIQSVQKRMSKVHKNGGPLRTFGSELDRIFYGFLGEAVVAEWLGILLLDTFDFDLIHGGMRLEVKTIACTSPPKPHYLATVNSPLEDGLRRQDADAYLFVRLLKKPAKAFIVGWLPCEEFWKTARRLPPGQEVYPGQKFTKAWSATLPISSLKDPISLMALEIEG